MTRAVSAFIENSSRCGNEYGTAVEDAGMGRLKHLIDLAERMLLDELANLDAAIHHEFQGGGIEFGRASPVPDRARVERHQVGAPDLDLVHRESDDSEGGAMVDQTECRFLAGTRAGAFENNPLGLAQAVLLGKFLDRRFDVARRHLLGICLLYTSPST